MKRGWALALLLVAAGVGAAERPRIGLVLSGGGARGLAHIGVLKVLERERIPVDRIAGTSMGAIIGGLYASGMDAASLERELLQLDWAQIFASRVDRQHLSLRRKEEDFAYSDAIELGARDGELRAPQGTVSSRGLEVLLRRLTLPVRGLSRFDQLPTPFRAVTTDMETGEALVLEEGDLAQALRALMSVPGVFAPIELEDRLLGDGGLVNNLPIDVARRIGAERVIAVNVGTPLSGRAALGNLLGLTTQMINILTEQNVKRSLATLWEDDVLISPGLGELSSADFERAAEFIRIGEASAEALLGELRPLALSPADYAAWQTARSRAEPPSPRLAALRFEGSERTRPARWLPVLASQAGAAFDAAKAVRDTRLLAASGDYARVDFRLEPGPDGDTLVFDLEDKPWGPHYFKIGLDLATDSEGLGSFNLRLSHNRHWANQLGAEWRNQLAIGRSPRLFSEWYQPFSERAGTERDWFGSGWGELLVRRVRLFDADGTEFAQLRRRAFATGLDLGKPFGRMGELRLGPWQEATRWTRMLGELGSPVPALRQLQRLYGLRAQARVDQLDEANFPREGWRVSLSGVLGRQTGVAGRAHRLELEASQARSWGPDTLNLHARLARTEPVPGIPGGPYALGGFLQLSGLRSEQLSGNALLLLRAGWYRRLSEAPVLTRGWFVGGSLEAGNTWLAPADLSLRGLRWGASAYLGADTGIGPLYLALGRASDGATSVYLFIGRP